MLSYTRLLGRVNERVALKDEQLVYKACSTAFARMLGVASPREVIGKTDFDLFPGEVAREQMALDSRAMYSAEADISAIAIESSGAQAVIVRTPVLSPDRRVRGLDIRLLGGPPLNLPPSAMTIDYQTLVNDGLQGSLIFSDDDILFANENAARVLGFTDARRLSENGHVKRLFSEVELARIAQHAARLSTDNDADTENRLSLTASTHDGKPVRLIARVAHVQWGAARATLLSFVDVELPVGMRSTSSAVASGQQAVIGSIKPAMSADELQRLRISEQRFRHYARAAADFFWELDAKLMFRFVSEDLERVLGIPRDHLVGRTHRQLIDHPANINEADFWDEQIALVADHKPFRDFEFRWSVDGETRVIRYSGIPVFNRSREFLGYRGTGCDVTASVRQAEATAYHANHDTLTGLFNRRYFEGVVEQALSRARSGGDRRSHALCFMDLDSFKIINDTCGHKAGDELLRQLAQLFDSLVRKSDVLGRIGGDEFGVFLYHCSVAEALKLANQIRHEVENFQFLWEENRFTIGVSVGLVIVDDRWEKMEALFSAADSACYIAKNEGRNRVVVYREGEGNASNRKVATHWVEEITVALQSDRMHLARQRIQRLGSVSPRRGRAGQPGPDTVEGERVEVLLRLELPSGEFVTPQAFLPSAERYGLSTALDERAVDMTLAWLGRQPERARDLHYVCINLSSASFTSAEFLQWLMQRITDSAVQPSKLCFELTETATIANLAKASEFMQALSDIGVRFAIDDFGAGLSSFAYLRKLPVDFIKIDGLLIKDILDDPVDFTLVKSISEMSKSMGKSTVAEFVETERMLAAVKGIGIDFAQGYHIGEPEVLVV